MEPETFASIMQVAQLVGGFFDFLAFVALIVIALWKVRPAEPGLGYGIAAVAFTRFFCLCGSRSFAAMFDPIPFHDMDGVIPMVLALFAFLSPLITVTLWGVTIFALFRLADRAPAKT